MTTSRLHGLLADGSTHWMLNPGGASLDAVDMLARAGARCLFIDCERTAVGIESVTGLTRCAHSHGMATLLRSESKQSDVLIRYLDRGIDGLVVPHVETIDQLQVIREVVEYVTRGRPDTVFTVAQIESRRAAEDAEVLAAQHAVDAFLIGPNDLSHSLGLRGDTEHAALLGAIDTVVDALQRHGRIWGIPATGASAARWAERGARLLYGTLEQILRAGYAPMSAALVHPFIVP
jgi:4-hydroxy-2-oxoheptanedioate aldolase